MNKLSAIAYEIAIAAVVVYLILYLASRYLV